jgi:hypothetical protein
MAAATVAVVISARLANCMGGLGRGIRLMVTFSFLRPVVAGHVKVAAKALPDSWRILAGFLRRSVIASPQSVRSSFDSGLDWATLSTL